MDNGYIQSKADSCLWLKYNKFGKLEGTLLEWVDDIICSGSDDFVRKKITKSFKIQDYGQPTDFVGMQIDYDKKAGILKLFQEKYINKIAARYGISEEIDERQVTTPVTFSNKNLLAQHDDPRADANEFCSIIGALHFCAFSCRPEICTPIVQLSRQMLDPTLAHLKEARKILKYLHKTRTLGLQLRRDFTTNVGHANLTSLGLLTCILVIFQFSSTRFGLAIQ